jgi:GrpB-like predicted nucleotidyltransferase (UPF0157 family)
MILTPHKPAWLDEFAALRDVYSASLAGLILQIEHVGSTAVPGLEAKPILDIDIVIRDYDVFPQLCAALSRIGYTHNGDQGIRDREVFKAKDATAPLTSPTRRWMQHHLYVCPLESAELQRHLAFRNALRANADTSKEYARMKRSIADRSHGDRKIYAQIKERECGAFVERVLRAVPTQVS